MCQILEGTTNIDSTFQLKNRVYPTNNFIMTTEQMRKVREESTGLVSTSTNASALGTVYEFFGDCEYNYYGANRPTFKFYDNGKEFLLPLSKSLYKRHQETPFTENSLWSLKVYKTTTDQDGQPLIDENENPMEIWTMGGTQQEIRKSIKEQGVTAEQVQARAIKPKEAIANEGWS